MNKSTSNFYFLVPPTRPPRKSVNAPGLRHPRHLLLLPPTLIPHLVLNMIVPHSRPCQNILPSSVVQHSNPPDCYLHTTLLFTGTVEDIMLYGPVLWDTVI